MANGNGKNGYGKLLALITGTLTVLVIVFTAASSYVSVGNHVREDTSIHQTREQKEELIDKRHRLLNEALEVEIRHIQEKQIEHGEKLDDILEKLN